MIEREPQGAEKQPVMCISSESIRMSEVRDKHYAAWTYITFDGLPFVTAAYNSGSGFQGGDRYSRWDIYVPSRPDEFFPPVGTEALRPEEKKEILEKLGQEAGEDLDSVWKQAFAQKEEVYQEFFTKYRSSKKLRRTYYDIVNSAFGEYEKEHFGRAC